MLIDPGVITDIIGIVMTVIGVSIQVRRKKALAAVEARKGASY